jgi:predicted ATPase/class 3 adenylate cyclase
MKCPECQFENPDNAIFCGNCRVKLLLICKECGTENSPQNKYCNNCAHDLRESVEISPIDYSKPQSYTPKHLKDKILTIRSSIEGEHKLVTVFFADVADYTSMSEKLDPEEVHQIMDGCFKILIDEIHKYEGTINQFTGDGVMALFGAPVAHEDHAQRACYAALSVQKAMGEYGEKIKKDTGVDFKMRIGLNSGPVVVGSIGDDLRMYYTAVGDTTNLASRMENAADAGSVLVSENTHKIARSYFEFESIGKLEVKGKEKPQEAYTIIKAGEVETRIGASVAKGLTRFVGRRNSMAALMEVWEKAKAGSGQVVGIVGEAGVGKSRVLLEFQNRFSKDEVMYLEGSCLHYGSSMAYLPILDILRSYYDLNEGDREYILRKKIRDKTLEADEELKGVIAPFEDLLSLKVDDEGFHKLEPLQKREKTFEAIRDLLIRESQNKPLILAIEDLHWIDNTTEEFLNYLIGWLANTPILLILLYRPEYTHQWGSKSYYTQIGLDQLGIESSADLVRAMLEGGDVASDLRELVLNRAAGNPLFMEEFTHTLLENGSIQKQDDQFILRQGASDIQVPDTIQGIIAARMDRLEADLKRTMQVASVIGRDFAFRILQTITGMREELKSHLLNLQGLEFIYEKQLFPELEYIFKHALTQEVAYNSLLQKRKKEIHEKIGRAIEQIYAERIEEFYEMLAYHYSNGDNLEKTYQYLKLSGEKAVSNYSNQEALIFYKHAIQALEKQPKSDENKRKIIELIRLMTIPMNCLSFPNDSLQILQRGENLSLELEDEMALAFFYSRISELYLFQGESQLAFEYGERGFWQAEKIGDLDSMVQISSSLIMIYINSGQAYKHIEVASKVIPMMEEAHRQTDFFGLPYLPYTQCCCQLGSNLGVLGNFDEGQMYLEKGLAVATEIGDSITLGLAESFYGLFWLTKGDGKKSIEHSKKTIHHFEEVEYPFSLGFAWSLSGFGYYFLGDLETARRHCQKGLEIQTQSGAVMSLALPYICLAGVEYSFRDFAKAQSFAEKALTLTQDHGEKVFEAISYYILGVILTGINPEQIKRAEESILKGVKIIKELDLKTRLAQGYFYLGECFANASQKDKAVENLQMAEKMFKEMGIDFYIAAIHAIYADLYRKEGEQTKARKNLSKAIEFFKECGADGWVEKYEKELAALS